MANPINAEVASNTCENSGILSQLFQGPMFILIVVAVLVLGTSWWKDKKEKESFNKIKTDLVAGKIIKLTDGTVGAVVSVDNDKGTIVIDSAGTKLEKVIESIIFVYPEQTITT